MINSLAYLDSVIENLKYYGEARANMHPKSARDMVAKLETVRHEFSELKYRIESLEK